MKFTIDGTTYELAQSKVTFAEARSVEQVTGHTYQAIITNPKLGDKVDVVQAMIWISMKRVNPELAFSDIDHLEIDGIEWDDDSESEKPDPTEPVETPESSPVDEPTESE